MMSSNINFVPLIATLAGLIWLAWWLYEHLAWVA